MNERLFAEREIVQEIWKRTVPTTRNFAQRLFNLDRIERSLGLRFYPARLRAHRAFELTRKRDQGSVCESIFSRACSSSRRSRRLKLARPRREILSRRERRLLRSEEHTSELQSRLHLVCRLLLEKK